MPITEALAIRLAKRGILKRKAAESKCFEEEIIAEDYDVLKPTESDASKQKPDIITEDLSNPNVDDFVNQLELKIMGHPGCPNKWNIYHECSSFCQKYWNDGITKPNEKYFAKRKVMLKKYELPENWKEKYDPGTGRHFYWDSDTDLVSWLPPGHPKAVVTEAASHFREEMRLAEAEEEVVDDEDEEDTNGGGSDQDEEASPRVRISKIHSNMRVKLPCNEVDPMDPASYSDAPRGTWSSGMATSCDPNNAVDTTAAGSLYQMRPYPSPGAVLRANASHGKISEPDE